MALTNAQIETQARALGKKIFIETNTVAHSDLTALKAVINRLDQIFLATTTQLSTLSPGVVLRTAILDEIKTIAPNFSNQDAAVAMMIYVADAAGIINLFQ